MEDVNMPMPILKEMVPLVRLPPWGAGTWGTILCLKMTAGKGIQHAEMFPLLNKENSNPLELFQIWLNLPRKNKFVEPHYSMLWQEQIPVEASWILPPASKGINRTLYFFEGDQLMINKSAVQVDYGIDLVAHQLAELTNGSREGRFLLLQGRFALHADGREQFPPRLL